jgi:hypothetical protein
MHLCSVVCTPKVEKHLMHKIILIEQNGIIIVVNTKCCARERDSSGMRKFE